MGSGVTFVVGVVEVAAAGSVVGMAVDGAAVGVTDSTWVVTNRVSVGEGVTSADEFTRGHAATLLSSLLAHTVSASRRFIHGFLIMVENFLFIFILRGLCQPKHRLSQSCTSLPPCSFLFISNTIMI